MVRESQKEDGRLCLSNLDYRQLHTAGEAEFCRFRHANPIW